MDRMRDLIPPPNIKLQVNYHKGINICDKYITKTYILMFKAISHDVLTDFT